MNVLIAGLGPSEETLAAALRRGGHGVVCVAPIAGDVGFGVMARARSEGSDLIVINDAGLVGQGMAQTLWSNTPIPCFGPSRATVKLCADSHKGRSAPIAAGRSLTMLALSDGKRAALLTAGEIEPEHLDGARREIFDPLVQAGAARCALQARVTIGPDGALAVGALACRFTAETDALVRRWIGDPFPWLLGAAGDFLPDGDLILLRG